MTGSEIRQGFLDYFRSLPAGKEHTVVRSSPLVPAQDPTLLFTNAGMVQFKAVFLGDERRDYVRAASAQKCVRAGGKHNDLENVGHTARHHTFFEMLGNFSFGDYFKKDAIEFCWELLTERWGLPKDRLKATVFQDDDEAFGLWKKIAGMGDDRILRLGEKDNFWAMGDTGPCGPCSEIHFHQGDHLPCAEEQAGRRCLGPACECDRWLEIWNLVFMQFNRDSSGALTPLPKPSIDTGMGLERVAAVLQGKQSDYDTDLFRPLITHIERLASRRYGADAKHDVSMQVVADHARAATFLIADGVTPSNEWRGYVLRRIMRRAMRHGRMLGLMEPFLWEVTGTVATLMGEAYPEVVEHRARVAETVRQEEERFAETLDLGMAKIREYIESHAGEGRKIVDGKFLFTLYDTHGFPTDLAQEVFQDAGWSVPPESLERFESEMEAQRERARSSAIFGTSSMDAANVAIRSRWSQQWGSRTAAHMRYFFAPAQDLPIPESIRETRFVGHETLSSHARVLAMARADSGEARPEVNQGEIVDVILDCTPAYAESGGQVGDTGTIVGRDGAGRILNTFYGGAKLIVHRVEITRGLLRENDDVQVTVDPTRRQGLRLHHTGTHLLHAALRKVLGTHVSQAGSLVAPDHLRFDFSHGTGVKDSELEKVEDLVNEQVQANIVVTPAEMDLQEALKSGAMALFGEKYGDRVRVIKIGDFSVELCGGTHLDATGQIGLFKVTNEGAVASGVRRIEAVTAEGALKHVGREEAALRESAGLLKIPPLELPQRLQKLLEEQKHLEKQVEQLKEQLAKSGAEELVAPAKKVAGVTLLVRQVGGGRNPEELRALIDIARQRLGSSSVILLSSAAADGKVNLVASVTKDLINKLQAGRLVQDVAAVVGGKGGGRPDLAQGGGPDASKIAEALEKATQLIEQQIKV